MSGMCTAKIVAGVVALGATSLLGYNWITTGCPTGVCPTERAAAAITPAALTVPAEGEGCCALTAEVAHHTGDQAAKSACGVQADACLATAAGCCQDEAAETTPVAAEAPACEDAKPCCATEQQPAEPAMTLVAATETAEDACCFDKGLPEPCSTEKACCQENYDLAEKPAAPAP